MIALLKQLDWRLNLAVLFLIAAGILSLISTSPNFVYKQFIALGIGLFLTFLLIKFDWRALVNYRGVIFGLYIFVILLLILAYFFAPVIRGTRGWFVIGDFRFQISELVKLVLIVVYAHFFSKKHIGMARLPNLLASFFYFIIPAALVGVQPDFGSVLILFCLWLGFLLVSGIPWKYLAIGLIIFSVLGTIFWNSVLKDYQKERILGFLFPGRDPLGVNYNVIQSKIAIGSAGFFGKGFGQGTQSQLGFLPEAQTDFIFAAFIEEWGLVSGFILIGVFAYLILRIIKIGLDSENNFNRFICLGTAILFIVQFIFNVGSNLGLTPVIGVTFPFLSYGGSSLLTNLILLGIIQSISVRS